MRNLPKLNDSRCDNSTCQQDDYIYTFAGENSDGMLNSIEKLNAKVLIDKTQP